MSLLHFPSNPTVGQQYANANGIVYTWDGVKWLGAVTGSTISTIGYGTYTVSVNTAGNFVIPAGAIIEHADGSPAEFPGGTLINGPYRFTLTTSGSITLNGELFHSGGVIQSSTPPVPASTSTLWYDIGSGRSYVYYDGTWVDAAPEPSVPTHISAFTNDLGYITSTNTLVNGNQSIALDGSQGLQLNNVQYIYANSTGTAIDIYTGGTNYSEVWLFDNGPVQINTNGETHSWSFNTDGSTSLPGSLNYQVPGLGGSGHFDINSYYPVKITTGDSVDVAYSTWTFGWNGILELPGSLTGDPVVIQGAPITITISDNSGLVWGGALGTYTRLNGQTPPKWAPANYNPSSDSSITYDGGWQLNNPNFSHPLYVNTGTLTNPLTTWNPDTQFGLGSGNPVGTYTYNTWTFGLTTNSGNAGITFPDSSIQYTAWTGTVDYSNVTNAPVVDSTGTTVFNVVSATTIYINGQPVSGGTTSTLVSGTYTFAVSSTGSVTLNGVSFSSHGAQGTTGAQGTAGSNGTNGAQGTTGSTGSQGTAGSIGTNGTQGTTGAQGTAGSIGTNGTQGTTGAQGTAGTNGVQGVQGISGSASLNNLSTSISFTNTGVNPPSFVTTSTGVKISYYQQESPTTVDYATGIEPGGLWTSIPSATSNYAFKWYGGTSTLATLTGTGTFITNTLNVSNQITTPAGSNANLVLNPDGLADVIVTTSTQILMYATNTSISTTTGALVVTGGVGVGGNVTANKFVGDGSSLTNVTVTQQANIVGVQPNVTLVAGNYSYLFDNTGTFTMPVDGDIVMPGTNSILSVNGTTLLGGAAQVVGYYSTLGIKYPGGSTQYGMTLRPAADNTNAITFLNAAGTNIGSITQTTSTVLFNMPNRPAFRVYGAGTTNNLSTTVNTNGILNGNNYAVDYQQGTALNTSTGVFTAPLAGLYSIHLVARVTSNSAGQSQVTVIKNNGLGSQANQAMWETGPNPSVNHFGVSTIAKLAVGDTLVAKVTLGSINFDANDNWSVAYIG